MTKDADSKLTERVLNGCVRRETHGRVALLEFANAPVNALSIGAGLVGALQREVDVALADATIDALVLTGAGTRFSAGADIADFKDDPTAVAPIRTLLNQIEDSPKPIVMAINGDAFGGGLELALAGHARIVAPGAKLGLPEVTLGLLPGGGGTQRLPRLVGGARALSLMLGGTFISAVEAHAIGIVGAVAEADLLAEALLLADTLTASAPRRTRDLTVNGDGFDEAKAKATAGRLSLAQRRIIECVDAASGDFRAGLKLEADLFSELMLSQQARALRHLFFAQRAAVRVPGTATRTFKAAAVIGAGSMGVGISLALLAAGLSVLLVDAQQGALTSAAERIRQTVEKDVARGRQKRPAAEVMAGLTTSTDIGRAADADIVIEGVFEDMAVKRQIFEKLDGIVRQGAVLASNTSTLDLDAIASFTHRPEDVVGLHFFNPANVMKLLEIVRGKQTSPGVLASAVALARQIGKVGVIAGVCDGFIGNRMFEEYLRQAYFLLEEGCSVSQVDRALETWGMAMGPLRTMDLAGQDIGWSIRKRRAVTDPDRPYSKIPDLICEMGRFGQKTGAGYYRYEGGKAVADPEIDRLARDHALSLGVPQRDVADSEIVERCLYALINEGAKIVEEEIAARPSDLDVVYVNGYGFPAERGGPMFQADVAGLANIQDRIKTFQAGYNGWAWAPAPLLVRLAESGASLESLNGR